MSGHKLDTALKQTLTLTPQLQQAIRILNMNGAELSHEVAHMLDHNFMLEQEREFNEISRKSNEEEERDPESIVEHLGELQFDSDWKENYEDWQVDEGRSAPLGEEEYNSEDADLPPTLYQTLEAQLEVMPIGEEERDAALLLANALDDDGYLRRPLAEIAAEEKLDPALLEAGLHWLRQCEPTGVGAQSLLDCIFLQLDALPPSTPHRELLRTMCQRFFAKIHHNPPQVMERLGIGPKEFDGALQLLRSLNPHPGRAFARPQRFFIQPEVFVREKNGISYVEMNGDTRPHLSINSRYAALINDCNERDRTVLQSQLQEARWFLSAIEKRNDTIRKVATAIVMVQQEFFQQGELAMLPLTRQQVAEMLGIHESTVSRAVNGKYLSCKRGVYELRYFFSAQAGEEKSTTAIKAMLQKIVADEDSRNPYSDQQLSEELAKHGYHVARRTIAKYREALGIDTTNFRKRH